MLQLLDAMSQVAYYSTLVIIGWSVLVGIDAISTRKPVLALPPASEPDLVVVQAETQTVTKTEPVYLDKHGRPLKGAALAAKRRAAEKAGCAQVVIVDEADRCYEHLSEQEKCIWNDAQDTETLGK